MRGPMMLRPHDALGPHDAFGHHDDLPENKRVSISEKSAEQEDAQVVAEDKVLEEGLTQRLRR